MGDNAACPYAWLGNAMHLDRGVAKLAVFTAMAMMFLVSLTIPEAFTDFPGGLHAPSVFVGCYLVVRLLHVLANLGASREDPRLRRTVLSVLPGMLCGTAILFAAGFTTGVVQLGLWVLALVVRLRERLSDIPGMAAERAAALRRTVRPDRDHRAR